MNDILGQGFAKSRQAIIPNCQESAFKYTTFSSWRKKVRNFYLKLRYLGNPDSLLAFPTSQETEREAVLGGKGIKSLARSPSWLIVSVGNQSDIW